MTERSDRFSSELDELISEGERLHRAIQYECDEAGFKKAYLKALDGDKEKLDLIISKLPDFIGSYQSWYSRAQAVIKQVLPGRLSDFISYFDIPKGRKDITFQNYMIRDYLQGLQITRSYDKEVIVSGRAAIPEFAQQLNILKGAKVALSSTLMDLKAVLQADLFDTEIDSAAALSKAGYLRASGAICGVVIEKHLLQICDNHSISLKKNNPGISDLSQSLRDADIINVPQWRFIQHLADIRNICDHAKGREPTKQEIDDLVSGAGKIIKTIF